MQRLKLFIPVILFLGLGIFLMAILLAGGKGEIPSALINKPMPAFKLPALSAKNGIEDKSLLEQTTFAGQPYLINAWATWCGPCRYEHPTIIKMAKEGVAIVGLNYKDVAADAQVWLNELENPYTHIIFDKEGRLGLDLGVTGIPETYFVDAQGVIKYKHTGVINDKIWLDKLRPIWLEISQF